MGSEENFVFKHMRKNLFEEELFKCEDQRFEIDMVGAGERAGGGGGGATCMCLICLSSNNLIP